jgi:hypothetical protein
MSDSARPSQRIKERNFATIIRDADLSVDEFIELL